MKIDNTTILVLLAFLSASLEPSPKRFFSRVRRFAVVTLLYDALLFQYSKGDD